MTVVVLGLWKTGPLCYRPSVIGRRSILYSQDCSFELVFPLNSCFRISFSQAGLLDTLHFHLAFELHFWKIFCNACLYVGAGAFNRRLAVAREMPRRPLTNTHLLPSRTPFHPLVSTSTFTFSWQTVVAIFTSSDFFRNLFPKNGTTQNF